MNVQKQSMMKLHQPRWYEGWKKKQKTFLLHLTGTGSVYTHTHVTRTSALCWELLGVFKEFTLTSPVFSSFVPSITHSDRPDQSRAERAELQTNLNCIPQTRAQEKQTRHPSLTSWRTRAFSYKCTWAGFSNWEFQCLWLVNRWSVPDMDRHVLYDYTEKQVQQNNRCW